MESLIYRSPQGERLYGVRIVPDNDYICVSYGDDKYWYIVRVDKGKLFIKTGFATKELALGFGKMLHHWYGEYFPIWENPDWKDADLPSLVQYTIKDGEAIYKAIRGLDEITTDLNQFSQFL